MSALRKDALVSQAAAAKSVEAAHESLDYLSRHAQLNSLHLQGSVFVVSPRFKAVSAKQNGLSLGFDLDVTALEYEPKKGIGGGLFAWRVFAKDARSDEERAKDVTPDGDLLLEIKAMYFVGYSQLGEHRPDVAARFIEQIAEMASYPYFRSLVAQLTWAAGITLPILPVISAQRRAPRVQRPARPAQAVTAQRSSDPAVARARKRRK